MAEKTCTKCGETKPLTTEFWYWHNGHNDWQVPCRECRRAAARARYNAHPAKYQKKKREDRQRRAEELRDYERDYYALHAERKREIMRESRLRNLEKARRVDRERGGTRYERGRAVLDEWYSQGCVVCGQYIEGAMHAHHRVPEEKAACPSQLCMRALSTMAAELAKCDPYCANHHGMLERRLRNGDRDRDYADVLADMRTEWAEFVRQLTA